MSCTLTTDTFHVFRRSTYDKSVRYAVSLSTARDKSRKSRRYNCPVGYHWASTDEEKRIFQDGISKLGVRVYLGQCNGTVADWKANCVIFQIS